MIRRLERTALAAAMAAFLVVSVIHAATYHVSNAGDDTWDGSESTPYASIDRAGQVAQPGDKVYVHEGSYSADSTSLGTGVEWESVKRHGAVVDGGGTEQPILVGGEDVTLRGFVVQNTNCREYEGILHVMHGWTIEDCIIQDAHDHADGIVFSSGIREEFADNVTMERTIIQNCGTCGFWGSGMEVHNDSVDVSERLDNHLVKDCILRRNNQSGSNTGWGGAAMKMLFTNDMVLDGVISYDNFGSGLWMDFGNSNFTIKNCTVFGNHCGEPAGCEGNVNCSPNCSAIFSESNPGPGLITGNTVYRNNIVGINISESADITVEENLCFDNNYYDITVRCCCAADGREPIHDCTFRNNQYSVAPKEDCSSWNLDAHGLSTAPNLTWENNVQISSFPAPLPSVNITLDPSPQLQSTVEENTTIDDAIAGASAGDEVTIPVFGRKAIEDNGDQWMTEVYDLNARYVELFMDDAGKAQLESEITQFASITPTNVTVTLEHVEEYLVRATLGDVIPNSVAAATGSRARVSFRVRKSDGRLAVAVPATGARTVATIAGANGRILVRRESRGGNAWEFSTQRLPAGAYVVSIAHGHTRAARTVCVY
ncbi:MAG: DUF1565 domain-containing protein [Chitinivibrionales bacterium]|nr:DUF1565 domain-containing protein [Chitinivibrionales bacterium]MBD3395561.1 DUF1565 domain-containing protein [Chitinivibrionales bacterium]